MPNPDEIADTIQEMLGRAAHKYDWICQLVLVASGEAILVLVKLPKPFSKFSSIKNICSKLDAACKSMILFSPQTVGFTKVKVGTGFIVAKTAVRNNDSQVPLKAVT
jgi:hypothetical protein